MTFYAHPGIGIMRNLKRDTCGQDDFDKLFLKHFYNNPYINRVLELYDRDQTSIIILTLDKIQSVG